MADHADVKNLAELKSLAAKHKVVLVDFHATWCPPCKAIGPYVVSESHKQGIFLAKVDVDQAPDVSTAYGITAMPTFKVIGPSGEVLGQVVGGGEPNVNSMLKLAKEKKAHH